MPSIPILLILPLFTIAQIDDNSILDDFGIPTTTISTIPPPPPPPDPFRDLDDNRSLDDKLDELDQESQEIVIDFVRHGRKLYGDLRRRLILYVMKFSPVQTAVEVSGDAAQIQKIEKIKYRFRTGLKIKYSSLKSRIDRLVAHLLAPIFAPFMLLQPDEIRPFFSAPKEQQSDSKEPVTVAPQEMAQAQSSFTALELFPSSLPHDKWPQFDQRWINMPQANQFSMPSFTPFYQPFQYYRQY